jgi:3-oxoadipate enol-lactonase/4-carboxymuconolactone decarboxylase
VTVPHLTAVRLGGRPDQSLLVLGPALGTSARALWADAAEHLAADFQVVAWDLPGHGTNGWVPEPGDGLSVADLARGVLAIVDELQDGLTPPAFHYAGVSVGGAVGLQLLLDAPRRVRSATLLCTGARIGDPELWGTRAAAVAASGTSSLTGASTERWFAPGFDVRDRLPEVAVPVLAVAGAQDGATPAELLAEVADGVRDGRLVVLDDVAHLPPVEAPEAVARLVRGHALGEPLEPLAEAPVTRPREESTVAEVREAGTAVRREVLGGAYVARTTRQATEFTRDFQDLVAEFAWGSVWTRPGLDRRSRSIVALTALVAGGHHDLLAEHVRAARATGLTVEEIREVLLQTAVYCGLPAADGAFRIAQRVLHDMDEA